MMVNRPFSKSNGIVPQKSGKRDKKKLTFIQADHVVAPADDTMEVWIGIYVYLYICFYICICRNFWRINYSYMLMLVYVYSHYWLINCTVSWTKNLYVYIYIYLDTKVCIFIHVLIIYLFINQLISSEQRVCVYKHTCIHKCTTYI
jgi:hypothetical protein